MVLHLSICAFSVDQEKEDVYKHKEDDDGDQYVSCNAVSHDECLTNEGLVRENALAVVGWGCEGRADCGGNVLSDEITSVRAIVNNKSWPKCATVCLPISSLSLQE